MLNIYIYKDNRELLKKITMGLIEANDQKTYENNLQTHSVNVVMFTGQNCPACRVIEPEFRQKALKNTHANFMIVNSQYFSPFRLEAIPTFVKFTNGQMIDYFKATGDWNYNRMRLEKICS